MSVDETSCDSMNVEKGRRWYMMVVRVHESR